MAEFQNGWTGDWLEAKKLVYWIQHEIKIYYRECGHRNREEGAEPSHSIDDDHIRQVRIQIYKFNRVYFICRGL